MTAEHAGPSARVVADSVSPAGHRLTTMEVTFHRFVLAEFNTHRVFSRSSASSRAIPVEKQLERVKNNPAEPLRWPSEQPGMQGGTELQGADRADAGALWSYARQRTIREVEGYLERHPDKSTRLHKSLINRLLEPFMWHTVIVSSTEWENFFEQRCSPLAQPEIRAAAEAMRDALYASTPILRHPGARHPATASLAAEGWHLPYIDRASESDWPLLRQMAVSVARCARVSYLNHEGEYDPEADVALFKKLVTADPPHSAPLEMVAEPMHFADGSTRGNFEGWRQLRHKAEVYLMVRAL